MLLEQARTIAAEYGVNVKSKPFLISTPDANPKTAKNEKFGVLTSPLHLAPASLSGFNVCAKSTQACRDVCLHTAGNPAYMAGKERARVAKTKLYFGDREAFLRLLIADMAWLSHKAENLGLKAGLRLNATSDIPFETVRYDDTPILEFARAADIHVYDYTKIVKRAMAQPYHLTFSRTEDNWKDCAKVLRAGGNVAAVFRVTKSQPLPDTWCGFEVINGDESDWRPGDKPGTVVGLKAKGKAVHDTSGFVINANI